MNTNLLNLPTTYLPETHPDHRLEPELGALAIGSAEFVAGAEAAAKATPDSSLAWAMLAEAALAENHPLAAYAYARTGYHRGLDSLRRAGWRGQGDVPASHPANRGFLRALAALHQAAKAINETDEVDRTAQFLRDLDADFAKEVLNNE